MNSRTAACIGTGLIGRSWALVLARCHDRVWLFDADANAGLSARAYVHTVADRLANAGLVARAEELCNRIQVASNLNEAVSSASYVQESASENLRIKRELFKEIDRLSPPDAILASSTSEYPPSDFLIDVLGRKRCLVAHPLNPPHLIPAVEVCPGSFTSPDVIARCIALLGELGQRPILVRHEIRGFIMNRLQLAVMREALSLVQDSVCSVADVDAAMTFGLARRWAAIGPFEASYLATEQGYEHFLFTYGKTLKSIADDLSPNWSFDPLLGREIDAQLAQVLHGEPKVETEARRDRNLSRLANCGLES